MSGKFLRRHGSEAIGQLAASEESTRDNQGEGLGGGLEPPAIICSRLKESLTRYEAAVKGVDETYLRLEEEQGDDQTYEEWSTKHSEYLKPKEEKIAEVVQRISEWEAAAYAAHAQAIRDNQGRPFRQGPGNPSPKLSTPSAQIHWSRTQTTWRSHLSKISTDVTSMPVTLAF